MVRSRISETIEIFQTTDNDLMCAYRIPKRFVFLMSDRFSFLK